MKVAVILFGSECEEYPGMACPIEVHTFDDRVAASEFMARQPAWTRPHKLYISNQEEP